MYMLRPQNIGQYSLLACPTLLEREEQMKAYVENGQVVDTGFKSYLTLMLCGSEFPDDWTLVGLLSALHADFGLSVEARILQNLATDKMTKRMIMNREQGGPCLYATSCRPTTLGDEVAANFCTYSYLADVHYKALGDMPVVDDACQRATVQPFNGVHSHGLKMLMIDLNTKTSDPTENLTNLSNLVQMMRANDAMSITTHAATDTNCSHAATATDGLADGLAAMKAHSQNPDNRCLCLLVAEVGTQGRCLGVLIATIHSPEGRGSATLTYQALYVVKAARQSALGLDIERALAGTAAEMASLWHVENCRLGLPIVEEMRPNTGSELATDGFHFWRGMGFGGVTLSPGVTPSGFIPLSGELHQIARMKLLPHKPLLELHLTAAHFNSGAGLPTRFIGQNASILVVIWEPEEQEERVDGVAGRNQTEVCNQRLRVGRA